MNKEPYLITFEFTVGVLATGFEEARAAAIARVNNHGGVNSFDITEVTNPLRFDNIDPAKERE